MHLYVFLNFANIKLISFLFKNSFFFMNIVFLYFNKTRETAIAENILIDIARGNSTIGGLRI